ncbi:MAG: TonB-dep-Rec domain-containing protein [Lactiplantibacillus plantarum]
MAYLTFEEYKGLGFSRITDEATYVQHEVAAETQIDITTQFFYNADYAANSLVDDLAGNQWQVFRAKQFKRAVALQCDYFDEVGADTPVGIANQDLSSIEIGRTHVQANSNVNATNFGKTGLANGVVEILAQIGLMSRAVSYR